MHSVSGYGVAPAAAAAAPGEASVLRQVRRVFTDAELKALPTTGTVDLVPAAADRLFLIHMANFAVIPWVAAYTNLAAGAQLKVWVDPGFQNTFNSAGAIFTPAAGYMMTGRADALFGIDYTALWAGYFQNKSLKFSLTNGANGNLTGGDVGNRFVVTVFYLEIVQGS